MLNILSQVLIKLFVYLSVLRLKIKLFILNQSRPKRNVLVLTRTHKYRVAEPLQLRLFRQLIQVSFLQHGVILHRQLNHGRVFFNLVEYPKRRLDQRRRMIKIPQMRRTQRQIRPKLTLIQLQILQRRPDNQPTHRVTNKAYLHLLPIAFELVIDEILYFNSQSMT